MIGSGLDRALGFKNPEGWVRGLKPEEIAMVNEECRWLGAKFSKVREMIMDEKLRDAGCEFEKLIEALPTEFRRALGLLYLEISDEQESENPI